MDYGVRDPKRAGLTMVAKKRAESGLSKKTPKAGKTGAVAPSTGLAPRSFPKMKGEGMPLAPKKPSMEPRSAKKKYTL